MQTSVTEALDLSQEPEHIKRLYGIDHTDKATANYARRCLMARRLVEAGVPFVQVNWSDHVEAEEDAGDGGWDHHYRNFQIMQDRHAMWLDQAVSAFLTDLERRGLLKTTLVLAFGEFGRSPKHHPGVYCALAFGGGVAGGRVIGESDAKANKPKENPITPADVCATLHHAVGITSEMSASLNVGTGGRVISELF